MSIIIFGDLFTFPDGNAATNRVYTYAKGFVENRMDTHVVCFDNEYLEKGDGTIDGFRYYHPLGQKKRNKYFLIRRWYKLRKFYRTIILFKKINKQDKIDGIICYSRLFQTRFFGFLLSRIYRTKMILEVSEHPLRDYQGPFLKRVSGNIKLFLEIRLCDGINCISHYLIDFYLKRGLSQKKLFLVPSTVDTGRFQSPIVSKLNFEYILYCGELNLSKDGVDILIRSFTKISEKFSELNLVLIGSGDSKEVAFLKNIASEPKIQDRVYFLGQLNRTEIPDYQKGAKVLALSRPESILADAGFPSKLTEYLAVGKPVVVTKVGEIPDYLFDGENAFLAEPGSTDAFSDKLNEVLSNYDSAQKVALKGKELTMKVFNYNFQAGRIIEFINSLKS